MADTADPLAGSYDVEALTDEYERRILELIEEIEGRGGMAACIDSGWVAREVLREAYRHSLAVERGERLVVGENIFEAEEAAPPTQLFEHSDRALEEQLERLEQVRTGRDDREVARALAALRGAAAKTGENIMPATVEAARVYATVGEIFDVLRDVFGEYREPLDIF